MRGQDERSQVLRVAARLVAERFPVDLRAVVRSERPGASTSPSKSAGATFVPIEEPSRELPGPSVSRPRAREERTARAVVAPSDAGAMFATERSPHESVGATASSSELSTTFARTASAVAEAHGAYLRFAERGARGAAAILALQSRLLEAGATVAAPVAPAPERTVAFDREACLEFARGTIARVLGP
ncbi:hypothetical protein HY251_02315, partial [bacterium]|nr:hypothetical protein [bacterium]